MTTQQQTYSSGDMARDVMHAILRLQTTFRQSVQRSMRDRGVDLTFEMLQILSHLWRKDGMNQQELGTLTFKDKASLTSLLNNLETRGIIIRVEDERDRRSKKIMLTELGVEYGGRVRPLLSDIYASAERSVEVRMLTTMVEHLTELNDAFKG